MVRDTFLEEKKKQIFSNCSQNKELWTDSQAECFLPYNSFSCYATYKVPAVKVFPQKH